ncbi:MAG: hypothetical protein OHK006_18490 [Thermodesulfovibrionales bacterium]
MNNSDFNEKSASYLIGKEFVIVIVVVCSALSFTLGFYVGKSGRTGPDQQAAHLPQQNLASAAAPLPADPGQIQESSAQAPVQQAQPGAATEKKIEEVVIEEPKERPAAPAGRKPAAPVAQTASLLKQTSREASAGSMTYSVQLGAFRSQAEAKACKTKYEKKGMKPFIVTVTGKQKEKTYKVKTGEFSRRQDAEMLAVKLKKSEGMNAFVTPRNE